MPKNIYREANDALQDEVKRLRRDLDRMLEKIEIIRAILMPVKKGEDNE